MSWFGLQRQTIERLVSRATNPLISHSGVAPDDFDPARDRADRFARAAWSTFAEPGDRVAGSAIEQLGPSAALRAVLEHSLSDELPPVLRDRADRSELSTVSEAWASAIQRWRPRLKSAAVTGALEGAAQAGAFLIAPGDLGWPEGMSGLGSHAPHALWVRGTADLLTAMSRSVSLVGARACTGYGEHVAAEASAGLVARGYAIVSGAAYGIDGMVHRTALASDGVTFAFLAGGVDRFYPAGHDSLLRRIVQRGAVYSEVPCGTAPTRWRFLQRNRLIAASSLTTIVLEAGSRSGSLNTAGHAASLGRPLGAVPGPVTSPSSAGCHRLLREYSAVCVTDAAQMAELAGGPASSDHDRASPRLSREETRVVDALHKRVARSLTELAVLTGMSLSTVAGTLGSLELDGLVKETEAGWRSRGADPRGRHGPS